MINKNTVLGITLQSGGVKTTLSVEFSQETYAFLLGADSGCSSTESIEVDLLDQVILPSLPEATQQLVQVNHIFSGNLEKYFLSSLRRNHDQKMQSIVKD